MAMNSLGKDDTDPTENWDACWNALERLSARDLPTVAMQAEAARIVNSCRAVTEGRGIEYIEERARAVYRRAVDRLTASSDEHLTRFIVTLDGALTVLRQVPGQSPESPQ